MNWHTLSSLESLELLESSEHGLSSLEAETRKAKYGRNAIEEKKKNPPWVLFLRQFTDFMILVLLAASLVSGLFGDPKDTILILIIVFLNAVIGFIQEYRAEKAVEALKKISTPGCNARRDGELKTIPTVDLVPGDIVQLEAGNLVPADIRLLDAFSLKIEEASLTGESNPIEKETHIPVNLGTGDVPIGDRKNMAFKGTLITYGRGLGVVAETGMNTQIGSIARMLQEDEVATPLQLRLIDLGKKLTVVILGISSSLFIAGVLQGQEVILMLMTSISIAVAAIPSALPAVLTISLALGASRMVKLNAIIRKLPAVETLGSITFICSDKTGTITQNRMSVKEIYLPENIDPNFPSEAKSKLVLAMGLNHDAVLTSDGSWKGDPTEIALADFSLKNGASQEELLNRLAEVPFDSERKRMTTVHKLDGQITAFVKGAVESILSNCVNTEKADVESVAIHMAKNGRRVIAYSYRNLDSIPNKPSSEDLETNLTFLGLVALMDPPRPEAALSVTECRKAGIIPVMITGDHPETARSVASEVGILKSSDDILLTGSQLCEYSYILYTFV
jgi:Ca2+-transporting ATPase